MTTASIDAAVERLREAVGEADAIAVGAGAGLSTAAGFTYSGERFERLFGDFIEKYGFRDMYSAGFSRFARPRSNGPSGAATSGATATSRRPRTPTPSCCGCSAAKTSSC